MQVRALRGPEAQSRGERVEDLPGGAHVAALLEEGVVGRGDRREQRDLLAAEPAGAPTRSGRQPDVDRLQTLTPGAQQVAQRASGGGLVGRGHPGSSGTSNSGVWVPR